MVRGPEGDVHAYGKDDGRTFRIYVPGLARFEFSPNSHDVRGTPSAGVDEEQIADVFRTTVRPLALHIAGFEALHASSVRHGGCAVAFCGSSGTGKSTVAYGLSLRGWPLWSDDTVVFDSRTPEVRCFQLPYALRLRDPSRRFFGVADDRGTRVDEGEEAAPQTLAAVTVLERRRGGGYDVERLDAGEAMRAVLPHAYRFTLSDRHRARRTIGNYLDLVRRVPVLRARFSPGFERLPPFLDELEESLRDLVS